VASCRRQALIDAPVEAVWNLVGDPARYPEWAAGVIDVTGLAQVEHGAEFRQTTKLPIGRTTTTFRIDALEELHEIHLTCEKSGLYSHWELTEAQNATFVDVEIGMEAEQLGRRAFDAVMGKRWYRVLADDSLDGLRAATAP
jgi:carbon monoxide dehydrogenase subunit G